MQPKKSKIETSLKIVEDKKETVSENRNETEEHTEPQT